MTDNELIQNLEQIINENSELKTKIAAMEVKQRNWGLRERLYQSELQTLKNTLLKLANGIKTSPHISDAEYNQQAYGESNGQGNDR